MWKYYALLSAVFASLTALFSKMGVRDVNSDLATAVRVSFLFWSGGSPSCPARCAKYATSLPGCFLFLSAVATGLSWLFSFRALQFGDVSRVVPIDKLSVPLTIFLSILLLGESASLKVLLGGALITAGSLVLLL